MSEPKIRKLIVSVEETHREIGKAITPPTRKACAIAVIENPFAGRDALLQRALRPFELDRVGVDSDVHAFRHGNRFLANT